MRAPVVSVVCATYRRPEALSRLLRALAAQDLEAPFEVVISDDGSGDLAPARAAVAEHGPSVRLLEHPTNRGPAAARNDGWRAASAPVVAFTDDDCQPTPGWLRAGLAALVDDVALVVGRVDPDPSQARLDGPWARSLTVHDARFMQTANAFYRKEDLDAVGGFDPAFRHGGEDTDLGLRVLSRGGRGAFAPDALVLHDVHPGTARSLARASATRWTDLPLVLRRHPEMRRVVHHRVFWKQSHPATIAALVGLAMAPFQLLALVLVLPWLVERGWRHPPRCPRRARPRALPGAFLVDVAEVVGCVRGSIRHRTLLL